MHKTQAYKTCDGKLFDNEAEAARHEATIKIRNWAERRKINTNGQITWDAVFERWKARGPMNERYVESLRSSRQQVAAWLDGAAA